MLYLSSINIHYEFIKNFKRRIILNIQLKQGVLEMCILSYINTNQKSGYQIEKALTGQFRIPEGSIYPLLRKMVTASFLEVFYIEESGVEKKYFKISPSGRLELEKLLNQWHSLVDRVGQLTKEAPNNE